MSTNLEACAFSPACAELSEVHVGIVEAEKLISKARTDLTEERLWEVDAALTSAEGNLAIFKRQRLDRVIPLLEVSCDNCPRRQTQNL